MAGKGPAGAGKGPDLVASGTSTTGQPLPKKRKPRKPKEATPAEVKAPADVEPEAQEKETEPEAQEEETEPEAQEKKPAKKKTKRPAEVQQAIDFGGSVGGFLLGVMFWTWIALPFLKNGTTGVKDQLRAKFFNKAHDGSWLP